MQCIIPFDQAVCTLVVWLAAGHWLHSPAAGHLAPAPNTLLHATMCIACDSYLFKEGLAVVFSIVLGCQTLDTVVMRCKQVNKHSW
jgi:hypothetical protein